MMMYHRRWDPRARFARARAEASATLDLNHRLFPTYIIATTGAVAEIKVFLSFQHYTVKQHYGLILLYV